MKRTEERKAWQELGLNYYDGDAEALKSDALAAWDQPGEPTLYRAILSLAKRGGFACYNSDILADLAEIYGDDYDESRYTTKSGDYKYKNGELYALSVYAHKLALSLEKLYA